MPLIKPRSCGSWSARDLVQGFQSEGKTYTFMTVETAALTPTPASPTPPAHPLGGGRGHQAHGRLCFQRPGCRHSSGTLQTLAARVTRWLPSSGDGLE